MNRLRNITELITLNSKSILRVAVFCDPVGNRHEKNSIFPIESRAKWWDSAFKNIDAANKSIVPNVY